MKIDQLKGRLLLKKPKIIDPLNETETIKDVMIVDGKIEKIGIIDAENDINFIDCNGLILTHGFVICMFISEILGMGIKKH